MTMANHPKPRQACVQFADPTAPAGQEVSTEAFLRECHQSALARFRSCHDGGVGGHTIEHRVPPRPGGQRSTGMIVAHVSPAVCADWENSAEGDSRQKHAHMETQMHLALEDLADQDMHGYLALTDAQCELYGPDLAQLVGESLDRTTFSHLGRRPDPHWEGTLVEQVQPPYLVLVVSIGFAGPARRKAPGGRVAVPRRRDAGL